MRYARLLAGYREANVIGARDPDVVLLDHILDSLSCFLSKPLWETTSLIDVGSGGGLPGVAIGLVRPETSITLVEATQKKVRFLARVVGELSLARVEILNARVEEAARWTGQRGEYEVATARALARLAVVAEYCVPLLRVGGYVISMKGRLDGAELDEGRRAARTVGAKVDDVIRVPLLTEVGEKVRHLVILRKTRETPPEYPRRVGIPARRPLGVV
ncbi:MAG TPA: 16S rRNA (guanine(527)-N(7))-methyltransferase RsmG [Rubrobacteraceae bacterium]|nr:16S rRNA (guanine(527)-N(7))-methyltransferase RsmG [Rubrobacteraceae bacterium]